jgi:hypothetical protein
MKNVSQGNGRANGQPFHLGALRCEVLAVLIGNPLFSREEQLRANHHVHECECARRLALWLHNVEREAARRERAGRALVREARQVAGCDFDTVTDELHQLSECPALTAIERGGIALLAPPDSPMLALALVGRYYVKALKRS